MSTQRRTLSFLLIVAALLLPLLPASASAHQPFFEDDDWTAGTPYVVADPTVSTALYAALESRQDVDYVTFAGKAGQRVLVGLTIPQLEGQEEFAPTLALLGPGLPLASWPQRVTAPENAGAVVLTPPAGPATSFFEPFSRTSYWERQEERITLPADGDYVVAVWHPAGAVGRYTLVIGDREIPGGDLAFPFKLQSFWAPLPEPAPDEPVGAATPVAPQPSHGGSCSPRQTPN